MFWMPRPVPDIADMLREDLIRSLTEDIGDHYEGDIPALADEILTMAREYGALLRELRESGYEEPKLASEFTHRVKGWSR